MIMLFKVLIFSFSALLLYQIMASIFKGTIREGYTRQDAVSHEKKISDLETQVTKNSDDIADLKDKSKNIEGFCEGIEGGLASDNPPYTAANEKVDTDNHEQRIRALQIKVTQNIDDLGIVNKKLGLIPANRYSESDYGAADLDLDKKISALEIVVRKNVVDITELQRQLKERADKLSEPAKGLASGPMPVISGTVPAAA